MASSMALDSRRLNISAQLDSSYDFLERQTAWAAQNPNEFQLAISRTQKIYLDSQRKYNFRLPIGYKRSLCPNVLNNRVCPLGDGCNQAHNLVTKYALNLLDQERYKSRFCKHGSDCYHHQLDRCRYVHEGDLMHRRGGWQWVFPQHNRIALQPRYQMLPRTQALLPSPCSLVQQSRDFLASPSSRFQKQVEVLSKVQRPPPLIITSPPSSPIPVASLERVDRVGQMNIPIFQFNRDRPLVIPTTPNTQQWSFDLSKNGVILVERGSGLPV